MTSTNDGKDVKSNQSSGQKGKSYYIELYKSLDAQLSGECDLRSRTHHLCEAWRRVHSLCLHALPATHPHLLSWLQRHTARTILQTEWQSPKSKNEHTNLEEAIDSFVADCESGRANKDGVSPSWETLLLQRGEWFKRILANPWGHPVLRALLDPQGQKPDDDEILEWLKEERGVMFVTRLRQLAASKCDDLAMALVTAVMDRVRAATVLVPDNDQAEQPKDKPNASSDRPKFADTLNAEAGFTLDVWELLTDIEFVLLHKGDRRSKCIELAKQTPLRDGYQLVERLQSRLGTSPREKKLWKNAKDVATLVAQVIIARCMVIPVCAQVCRTALYCCARSLVRMLPGARLPAAAAALAAPAATARHLHTLAQAVDAQCSSDMKPFVCELYVRAITAGMNELERLKLKTEKQAEARATEQTLSAWFTQLGSLLAASNRVECECTLTAFSVYPSPEIYEKIKAAPALPPVALDSQETKEETKSEFGSWTTDSRTQSNLVKTSETLKIKHTQNQANVLSTAILTEGEAIGLSPELCQDLAVLLSGPRLKTLSWDMDREVLLKNCSAYMEGGGTRALTTELKYLNLDPSSYMHLPEEDDEENDLYYGIEKGYEHLVEVQEPEDIWENAFDPEKTESACSSSMEMDTTIVRRKKKTKKLQISSEEDSDPLCLIAEIKRTEKKKERPHSKERSSKDRSKERKKKIKSKDNSEDKEGSREKRKENPEDKEKKKERKPRKKKTKDKQERAISYEPKPGSLSSLIGMKIANIKIPEGKYKKTTETKLTTTPYITDSDYDSQGKSSLASLNSEGNDPDVLFDGLYSMEEYKSPETDPLADRNTLSNRELSFTNGKVSYYTPTTQKTPETVKSPVQLCRTPKNIAAVSSNATMVPSDPTDVNTPKVTQTVTDEVKKSISRLIEFRRQKSLLEESHSSASSPVSTCSSPRVNKDTTAMPSTPTYKPNAIIRPDFSDQPLITSPKALVVPDIPKVYINKKQIEHIKELKQEVDTLLNAKCSSKPVIQYANKYPSTPTNYSDVYLQSVLRKERPSLPSPYHPALVQYPQTSKDVLTQKNLQDFLRELQESINAGTGTSEVNASPSRTPTKKERKPISRVTPIPKNIKPEPGTSSQCAKSIHAAKKVDRQLNTFSRLSYMHKSKQNDYKLSRHLVDSIVNSHDELLNKTLEEQKAAKIKYLQTKGDISISRVGQLPQNLCPKEEAKVIFKKVDKTQTNATREHPVLSNILQSNAIHGAIPKHLPEQDNQRTASQVERQRVKTPAPVPKESALSENDQNDLLLLLRQQNKLNSPVPFMPGMQSDLNNSGNSVQYLNNPMSCNTSTYNQLMGVNRAVIKNNPTEIKLNNTQNYDNYASRSVPFESVKNLHTKSDSKSGKVITSKNVNMPLNKTQNVMNNNSSLCKNEGSTSSMISESSKPAESKHQDWESVMNAILKHKTPSRGPNALDMALKKDSFMNNNLRNQRIIRTNLVLDSEKPDESSKLKVQSVVAKHTMPGTVIQKKMSSAQAAAIDTRKQNLPSPLNSVIKNPTQTEHPKKQIELHKMPFLSEAKEKDPFISGIPNSDYDLLEELMDDELRKEIGELSSDEESYRAPAPSNTKGNKNIPISKSTNMVKNNSPQQEKFQAVDLRCGSKPQTLRNSIIQENKYLIKSHNGSKGVTQQAPLPTAVNTKPIINNVSKESEHDLHFPMNVLKQSQVNVEHKVSKMPERTNLYPTNTLQKSQVNMEQASKAPERSQFYSTNVSQQSQVNVERKVSKIPERTNLYPTNSLQKSQVNMEQVYKAPECSQFYSSNVSQKSQVNIDQLSNASDGLPLHNANLLQQPRVNAQLKVSNADRVRAYSANVPLQSLVDRKVRTVKERSQQYPTNKTSKSQMNVELKIPKVPDRTQPSLTNVLQNLEVNMQHKASKNLDCTHPYSTNFLHQSQVNVEPKAVKVPERHQHPVILLQQSQGQEEHKVSKVSEKNNSCPSLVLRQPQINVEQKLSKDSECTHSSSINVLQQSQINVEHKVKVLDSTHPSPPDVIKDLSVEHKASKVSEYSNPCPTNVTEQTQGNVIHTSNTVIENQVYNICHNTNRNHINVVNPRNVIITAIPQPVVPNVVVFGSDLVYDPFTAVHTQLQSRLCNMAPTPFVALNTAPNITVYQTTQFAAPMVNDMIIGNAMTVPLPVVANDSVVTSMTSIQSQSKSGDNNGLTTPAEINQSCKDILDCKINDRNMVDDETINSTTKLENVGHVPIQTDPTVEFDSKVYVDINSNKNCQRKVLSEVQDKQTINYTEKNEIKSVKNQKLPDNDIKSEITKEEKNHADKSEKEPMGHVENFDKVGVKDKERLMKKRLAILNRKVSHLCSMAPIPLGYVPLLKQTQEDPLNIRRLPQNDVKIQNLGNSTLVLNNRKILNEEPHTDHSKENEEKNTPCRRILLRSSNDLKAMTIASSPQDQRNPVGRKTKVRLKNSKPHTSESNIKQSINVDNLKVAEGEPVLRVSKRIQKKKGNKIQTDANNTTEPIDTKKKTVSKIEQDLKQATDVYNQKDKTIDEKVKLKENAQARIANEVITNENKVIDIKTTVVSDVSVCGVIDIEEALSITKIQKISTMECAAKSDDKKEFKNVEQPGASTKKTNKKSKIVKRYLVPVPNKYEHHDEIIVPDIIESAGNSVTKSNSDANKEITLQGVEGNIIENSKLSMVNILNPVVEDKITSSVTPPIVQVTCSSTVIPGTKSDTHIFNETNKNVNKQPLEEKSNKPRGDPKNIAIDHVHKPNDTKLVSERVSNNNTELGILSTVKDKQVKNNSILPSKSAINFESRAKETALTQTTISNCKNTNYLNVFKNTSGNTKADNHLHCKDTSSRTHHKVTDNKITEKLSSNNGSLEPNIKLQNNVLTLESLKEKIVIEELPQGRDTDKKCVRIKLPNGKIFKATVYGKMHVSFESLFSNPDLRSTLLDNMNDSKRYTVNIKQISTANKNDPTKIVDTRIEEVNILSNKLPEPIETVSLLSDEEDECDNQNKQMAQTLKTEFGEFKISLNEDDLIKHREKLQKKCFIKLSVLNNPSEKQGQPNVLRNNSNATIIKEVAVLSTNETRMEQTICDLPSSTTSIENVEKSSICTALQKSKDIDNSLIILEMNHNLECNDLPNITENPLNKALASPVPRDVIEIEDSSNDGDVIKNTGFNKLKNIQITKPEDSTKKLVEDIDELKNLLLKDLGVDVSTDTKNTLQSVSNIEPLDNNNSNRCFVKTKKCFVKLQNCDDLVKKYEQSRIMNQKCTVDLFRCDDNIKPMKCVSSDDEHELETNVSDDFIQLDAIDNINVTSECKLNRSGSFSLLNDLSLYVDETTTNSLVKYEYDRSSPVMEAFQTMTSLRKSTQDKEKCLSVMEVFEIIASFRKQTPPNDSLGNLQCCCDWYATKRLLHTSHKEEMSEALPKINDIPLFYESTFTSSVEQQIDAVPTLKTLTAELFKDYNILNYYKPYLMLNVESIQSPSHKLKRKIRNGEITRGASKILKAINDMNSDRNSQEAVTQTVMILEENTPVKRPQSSDNNEISPINIHLLTNEQISIETRDNNIMSTQYDTHKIKADENIVCTPDDNYATLTTANKECKTEVKVLGDIEYHVQIQEVQKTEHNKSCIQKEPSNRNDEKQNEVDSIQADITICKVSIAESEHCNTLDSEDKPNSDILNSQTKSEEDIKTNIGNLIAESVIASAYTRNVENVACKIIDSTNKIINNTVTKEEIMFLKPSYECADTKFKTVERIPNANAVTPKCASNVCKNQGEFENASCDMVQSAVANDIVSVNDMDSLVASESLLERNSLSIGKEAKETENNMSTRDSHEDDNSVQDHKEFKIRLENYNLVETEDLSNIKDLDTLDIQHVISSEGPFNNLVNISKGQVIEKDVKSNSTKDSNLHCTTGGRANDQENAAVHSIHPTIELVTVLEVESDYDCSLGCKRDDCEIPSEQENNGSRSSSDISIDKQSGEVNTDIPLSRVSEEIKLKCTADFLVTNNKIRRDTYQDTTLQSEPEKLKLADEHLKENTINAFNNTEFDSAKVNLDLVVEASGSDSKRSDNDQISGVININYVEKVIEIKSELDGTKDSPIDIEIFNVSKDTSSVITTAKTTYFESEDSISFSEESKQSIEKAEVIYLNVQTLDHGYALRSSCLRGDSLTENQNESLNSQSSKIDTPELEISQTIDMNSLQIDVTQSLIDDEFVLNGIEYEDPEVGTCYVFPIAESSSSLSSDNDVFDDDTEEILQVTQEIGEDGTVSNVTLETKEVITEENYYKLILPKLTYSTIHKSYRYSKNAKRPLKRKIDMSDVRITQKKYRKSKNIDYPKNRAPASKSDSAYSKEFKQLFNYCSTLKFSYTQPFHKECIDVDEMLRNWPLGESPYNDFQDSIDEDFLFCDLDSIDRSKVFNPMDQSLADEISAEYNEIDFSPSNVTETNFNMGFGEGSDRVIQNLEDVGDDLKFSAATLSDVKQPQPFLLSEDYNEYGTDRQISFETKQDQVRRYLTYIQMREKVRSFFKKTTIELKYDWIKQEKKHNMACDFSNFPFDLYNSTDYIKPPPTDVLVQVVQVGQLPVSAAAQNPVTCDPRVTQVSDASPSQCSVDNSPQDDSQPAIKTEYTELTTAEMPVPLMQEYAQHNQALSMDSQVTNMPRTDENIPIETEIKSEVKIELMEESEEREEYRETYENCEPQSVKQVNNVEYSFDTNSTNANATTVEPEVDYQALYNSSEKQNISETYPPQIEQKQNGGPEKTDQIAHAMNAAGITTASETMTNTTRAHALVNILSQKLRQGSVGAAQATNSYPKTTSINAMSLQQALAQILPPPLNQTTAAENNQQVQNTQVTPQVLHIVQGKNTSGSQITLVDNSQQSVINAPNATPVLHIVQNKSGAAGANTNGAATPQTNSFGSLSLVDAGLQQGGNQLLHIVNTGNQKNNTATGQLLKRVNLLTNLTNVQGSNEQKMVQFVCKSADGKAIQLNAPHQRSMVLRLQPIETPNVQTKPAENQDLSPTSNANNSLSGKDNTANQQEIKSRSMYEENYAKFIQNSSNKSTVPEKSTSLPKFNQAFGKPVFQEGNQNQNDINSNSPHLSVSTKTEPGECQANDNAINLDHIGQISSPPLLLRKSPAQTSQSQANLVQQLKQTITPMNIQTMHGGVIYTRQIPVNIGGGQTINLITVPSTELVDDSGQKQQAVGAQNDMEPSIIKIVPQNQTAPNTEISSEDGNAPINVSNENNQNPQPQPVLTQMRIKLPMLSKAPQMVSGARVVRPSFFQIQRNVIGGTNQPVYQQLVLTAAPPLGQQTIRLPQAQTTRQIKVPTENQSSAESQMSSSTLEQLREFDMVLEQVKERSSVPPNSSSSTFSKLHSSSSDTTDGSSASSTSTESTQQVLYSIGNSHPLNVAYVNRKATVATPTTSTFVRSPDSSGIVDSPTSSSHVQIPHTVTTDSISNETPTQPKPKVSSKSKSRPKASSNPPNNLKLNTVPAKTSAQKPLEDEQTTQRILYILAEYKEQVENSPDKDKPAPRRRSNPPSNPSGSSKRKKSSSGSRRHGARDLSPIHGEDTCRTMGSEDSSCGTSQGDCNESCLESHSPQDSPRKVVRKLTFEPETPAPTPRPQPQRNVIVADGQTITVARGTAGKPATAVLMPANYILPVSMVKGGQQIAIVTNRGPKLLTVGGGEGGATNALLLQRLIGPAGLKPVLARPGVRHVRLPTAALHNLQAFNLATATTVQPPDSTASPASAPTPPELIDTRATSSPWTDQDMKPERGSSPEGSEPWNLPSSGDPHDYSYEETVRADNLDRTVLDAIPDRYSPDMEAQRIFDKMFDVESKKSYMGDSPRCAYDIDASDCDDKPYHQVTMS